MNVNSDMIRARNNAPGGANPINDTNVRQGEIGLWLPLGKNYRAVVTSDSSRLQIVTLWLLGDFSHHCFEQLHLGDKQLGCVIFHTSDRGENDYEKYPVHVTIHSTEPDSRNAWSCSFLRLKEQENGTKFKLTVESSFTESDNGAWRDCEITFEEI